MGERLMRYYKYIADKHGLQGKMELAKMTKIPSMAAATTDDTPDRIALFKQAVSRITSMPAPDY